MTISLKITNTRPHSYQYINSCHPVRLLLLAAIFLLFSQGVVWAKSPPTQSWVQLFMAQSPNEWTVYQRKVEGVGKETGNSKIVDESPTLIAMKGMDALLRKDIVLAKAQAELLNRYAVERNGAVWFEFRWDYTTTWPYKMKAPWISGLAQGLGLSLNTWLYQTTGQKIYLQTAKKIARSYLVDITDGGFARHEADGSVNFEEYPLETPTHVLNGAALATLALKDYVTVSGENAYEPLLKSAYAWWDKNISRYQVALPTHPTIVSAYSLAPRRNELLFRFLSESPFDVMAVSLQPEGATALTLPIGDRDDDDRSGEAFLWFNPKFQNWSAIKEQGSDKFRSFVPNQGEYNHAPFTFSLPASALDKAATLRLHLRNFEAGEALVQLYTGKTYITVGKIEAPIANGDVSFPISQTTLNEFKKTTNFIPPVEPSYFTDNHLLISLLAQASGSITLQRAARLLEPSTSLTPGQFDASARIKWLLGKPTQVQAPNGNGQEAWHTEYPAVFEQDARWQMYYSAIGEDSRWRILQSISTDQGKTWSQGERVFDEATMPFKGSYAFPSIIYDKQRQRYSMVFSADHAGAGHYDAVMLTESVDLKTWTIPSTISAEGGLAPIIWNDGIRYHVAYTIKDGASFHVMEMQSLDRLSWTLPTSIASMRSTLHAGFYTLARLPGKKDFFMMERFLAPGRIEWGVMCRAQDSTLITASRAPFYVLGERPGQWDDYQYGMSFFRPADGKLRLFFNGIPFGAEHGGRIGMVDVDEKALWKNIDTSNCY